MKLIEMMACALLLLLAFKFMITVYKKLSSPESMEKAVNKVGAGMDKAAENVAKEIKGVWKKGKKKVNAAKKRRAEMKEQPIVTIR